MKKLIITGLAIAASLAAVPPASASTCSSPTAHNTELTALGGASCRTARQVAHAANSQYALGSPTRRLGVTYGIDPYTPGPRIWNCEMWESRGGRSMMLDVQCKRGRKTVLMLWVWRNVWMD